MTWKRVPLGGVLALALLPGCASLKVTVDVLNPVYLSAATGNAQDRIELTRLLAGDTRQTRQLEATLEERYRLGVNAIYGSADAVLARMPAGTSRDDARASLKESRAAALDGWNSIRSNHFACQIDANPNAAPLQTCVSYWDRRILAEAAGRPGAAGRGEVPAEVQRLLHQRRAAMEAATAAVTSELRDIRKFIEDSLSGIGLDQATRAAAVADVPATTQAAVRGTEAQARVTIIGGGTTLANMGEAYFASAAPPDAWYTMFNEAVGRGRFGGTDIAIKLNSTADFSIKGFVFDGRQTAAMVSKVGAEAVKILAASFGVGGISASDKPGLSVDQAKLVSTETTQIATAEAAEQAFRAALFRVADTILAEETRLGTAQGKTAVKAAIARLDAAASSPAN